MVTKVFEGKGAATAREEAVRTEAKPAILAKGKKSNPNVHVCMGNHASHTKSFAVCLCLSGQAGTGELSLPIVESNHVH